MCNIQPFTTFLSKYLQKQKSHYLLLQEIFPSIAHILKPHLVLIYQQHYFPPHCPILMHTFWHKVIYAHTEKCLCTDIWSFWPKVLYIATWVQKHHQVQHGRKTKQKNKQTKNNPKNCSFGRYSTKEKLFIVVHLSLGD